MRFQDVAHAYLLIGKRLIARVSFDSFIVFAAFDFINKLRVLFRNSSQERRQQTRLVRRMTQVRAVAHLHDSLCLLWCDIRCFHEFCVYLSTNLLVLVIYIFQDQTKLCFSELFSLKLLLFLNSLPNFVSEGGPYFFVY